MKLISTLIIMEATERFIMKKGHSSEGSYHSARLGGDNPQALKGRGNAGERKCHGVT